MLRQNSILTLYLFFFSSRRRHTRCYRDWSSDVCSSDLDCHHHADGGQHAELAHGAQHRETDHGEAGGGGGGGRDVGASEAGEGGGDGGADVAVAALPLVEQATVEVHAGVDRQAVEDGGEAQRNGVELGIDQLRQPERDQGGDDERVGDERQDA